MTDLIISQRAITFPWKTEDPFIFCAYHNDQYPQGNDEMGPDRSHLKGRYMGQDFSGKDGWSMYHGQKMPGFPYHPHRGFETVTINKQGVVDHSDSLGAAGRFMAGDVQWMTAGKGVQHSEMFPLLHKDKPNHLEIFQIWLNLPAKKKMVDPHFKMLWKEDIPVITTEYNGKKTRIHLVAGEYQEKKAPGTTPESWAADKENGVRIMTICVDPGGAFELDAAVESINRNLYFYEGTELSLENHQIQGNHFMKLKPNKAMTFVNSGNDAAYLLLLEGRPIKEPVAQHGPFVMNTTAEIQEAIQDYQRTQFGGWPWKEREKSHGPLKGRFAKHADGSEEVKS